MDLEGDSYSSLIMFSLLFLLLSPLLCQAASVYEQGKHLHQQDQWTVVDGSGGQVNTGCPPNRLGGPIDNCRLLRTIMDLLKVASTTYRCPTCNCEEAKAEDTCVAYVAAVVLQCRIPGINQHACVNQELSSGFPTGLVPCSSDAAVCTAIGSFTRKTAETHALICTDEEPSDREGRFLGFGHLGVFIKKITLAMTGANSLAANILAGRDALPGGLQHLLHGRYRGRHRHRCQRQYHRGGAATPRGGARAGGCAEVVCHGSERRRRQRHRALGLQHQGQRRARRQDDPLEVLWRVCRRLNSWIIYRNRLCKKK